MASDRYRLHRLRPGDEWALSTLAKGNARFGDGEDRPWVPPLSSEEASEFVSDPRTICVVAIHMETNHMAGFVYGGGLWAKGIHDGIAARLHAGGFASLTEAVGSAG